MRHIAGNSVCRKFRQTADDGKNYQVKFYNPEAIISVGYRADSERAIEFRRWTTNVLSNFAEKGYILERISNKNQILIRWILKDEISLKPEVQL